MLEKYNSDNGRRIYDIVTGDETWIYHYDPLPMEKAKVWVFEDDPQPVQVKRPRSIGKRMYAIFFSPQSLIQTVRLEKGATVTKKWYTDVCLKAVFEAIEQRRPKSGLRGIKLHHDNAPAHKAAYTMDYIQEKGITTLPYPPYSPDFAPCDF